MNKDTAIELSTYIRVGLAIWVLVPLVAKFIDSFYFHYPHVLADSIPLLVLGICITLLGAILAFWTIYLFKAKGQGTPNPSLPPKVFITSGPYRISRNPMALGVLLFLVGEAIVYNSPSLLGIGILYGVIIYLYIKRTEEPQLRERFGAPYDDYLERVPRFFPNPWKWYK